MASPARAEYSANTWHQVTPGAKWTHIKHNSGSSNVVYTESSIAPVGFNTDTPVTTETTISEDVYFADVNAGDFIFFYPISGNVDLTITTAD